MNTLTSNASINNEIYNRDYYTSVNSIKSSKNNSNLPLDITETNSSISNDSVIGYRFLKLLENPSDEASEDSFLNKYISQYNKIKKQIEAGEFGNDIEKNKDLLDNAFKKTLTSITNSTIKQPYESTKIKLSASNLIKYQKEHDAATTLVWIFKAEHKRILKEIDYYERKKNHKAAASLRNLGEAYKHVIYNLSNWATFINDKISDSLSSDNKDNLEKIKQLETE